jgi:DNA polymerase-3 subunit delta
VAGWSRLLMDAQRIDEQIKGQAPGDPWIGLADICLQLSGRRIGA